MMKIAAETASEHTMRLLIRVALRSANKPKLTKITVSHETRIVSKGVEKAFPADSTNINQRVS